MERIEALSDTLAIWDKQIAEEEMIAFIRVHANTNYNKGWDTIVECWSDGDILEVLSDCQSNLPCAIDHIQSMVDIYMDSKRE